MNKEEFIKKMLELKLKRGTFVDSAFKNEIHIIGFKGIYTNGMGDWFYGNIEEIENLVSVYVDPYSPYSFEKKMELELTYKMGKRFEIKDDTLHNLVRYFENYGYFLKEQK